MQAFLIRMLLVITLAAAAAGARADDKTVTLQPLPAAPETAAPERKATWEKAWPRIQQAEQESLAAINTSFLDVDGSFASAANNTPKFVEDILGWNGKWQFTVGMGGQVVNFGASLVDAMFTTKLGQPAGPDSFRAFARKEFATVVYDPDVFKRGIENAYKAYVTKLSAIENGVLVDLQVDLPDSDIRMPRIRAPKLTDALLAQVDAAVEDIIADSATDFGITVAKEAVSQVGGNIAASAAFQPFSCRSRAEQRSLLRNRHGHRDCRQLRGFLGCGQGRRGDGTRPQGQARRQAGGQDEAGAGERDRG